MRKFVLVALLALAVVGVEAQAPQGKISVAWDAVPDSPGATVTGYRVCVGTTATAFPGCDVVGRVTSTVVAGLTDCTTYFVAVKAIDSDGDESANWSNVVTGWPQPRVTSATPAAITAGRPQSIVFSGANFGSDSTVQIIGATIDSVVVTNCTSLTATVTASSPGSPVVTVRSGGIVGSASGTFQVVAAVRPAGVQGVRRGEQ